MKKSTNLLQTGDIRSTMEQGIWRDVRSVVGYSHDVPERRRALVAGLAAPLGATWTRRVSNTKKQQ